MKKKKMTVSIGIPAYNEEANIKWLLESLLRQRQIGFSLKKILIVSDGSIDGTNNIVRSFKDKKINLIVNEQRKGQVYAQNLIFSSVKTDLVVIMEADTLPVSNKYLSKLIRPIIRNPLVSLVQGSTQSLKPHTLIEKTLHYQLLIYRKFSINNRIDEHWFCSGRGGRAFAKSVFKNLSWPKDLPEDVYALLWCKQKKLLTAFEESAICSFRLPQTFNDLLKERQKINSGKLSLKNYFLSNYLKKFYQIPKFLIGKMFLYFFVTKPSYCLFYLLLIVRIRFNILDKKFADFWPTTHSTKLLYKTL